MQEDSSRSPSYTVACEDYVHVVEFSPFSSGTPASLLAYGGNQYVVVGTCLFQEEDMEIEGVEFNVLRAFHHELRVDALAWSPESRLDRIPTIRFCTAGADRKLRLLTSDLQDRHEVKVMEGHTSYINHLVFEPTEGKQIASVSDDHTCRVWDLDGNESTTLRLGSPGISVCWHPEEAFKLMVAEKKGTIRFYDLVTQQAILSVDCGQSPLMSADWCLTNTIKVGAVAGNDWLIWDITRSSYPQEKRPAHIDKARLFKWSRANENLFATTGCPGKICSQLLIHHLGHPQPVMIGSATVGSGLSWHRPDSPLSSSNPSQDGDSSSPCPPESPERPPPLDLDWGKKVDIVQQLINQTLLLNRDGCSSLLLLPGGAGGTLSPLESSLWPSLLPPLTPPSATVTSVSSFSPEATGSSPQGEWTVVELETHH